MKKSQKTNNLRALPAWLLLLLLAMQSPQLRAASADWNPNPFDGDWNNDSNWTPANSPNDPNDTATFAVSNITSVFLSLSTEVNGIIFNAGASAFTITASPTFTLTISGVGITNNSGITQNFIADVDGAGNAGTISFTNSATAGSLTAFTNNGGLASGGSGGLTQFFNTSSVGTGAFTNNGSTASGASGGATQFFDTASAGNGTFTNNGTTVSGGNNGNIQFSDSSSAGSGTFTNNGGTVSGEFGGETDFIGNANATAGSGTFTTNGGVVAGAFGGLLQFSGSTRAGTGSTFTTNGGAVSGAGAGVMGFTDTSTADHGTFTTNGSAFSGTDGGLTQFSSSATAGFGTFTTNGGTGGAQGGATVFFDSSTAGSGIFVTNGASVSGVFGGVVTFVNFSSASTGSFTNNGGLASGTIGGVLDFQGSSTAGAATVTNNGGTVGGAGGSLTRFFDTSSAGSATLIANAGTAGSGAGRIQFFNDSTGGTATVKLFGGGSLDISGHNASGVAIGSLEGTGNALLGANNLTVGSNNLSTTFSGVVQDSGAGGSFTKVGTGTLSLTNTNTYSGGTLINAGTLIAGADGALGTGNVSLTASSVTLTLQNGATSNYIADNANLSIVSGSTVNLNFSGNPDAISALFVNGVAQAPGLYGSAASGAPNQLPEFFGTGEILVTAIPEPSTWAMMLSGLALLLIAKRWGHRRSQFYPQITPIFTDYGVGPPSGRRIGEKSGHLRCERAPAPRPAQERTRAQTRAADSSAASFNLCKSAAVTAAQQRPDFPSVEGSPSLPGLFADLVGTSSDLPGYRHTPSPTVPTKWTCPVGDADVSLWSKETRVTIDDATQQSQEAAVRATGLPRVAAWPTSAPAALSIRAITS